MRTVAWSARKEQSLEEETLKGLPKAGDVLAGRYTIEGVIGVGGMGVVLAARHTVLGQPVAVKFLLPDLAKRQPEAAERFVREARAAIHLKSEHIARVMDVGNEPNGAAYMVMEFLEGRDLQRVAREQAPLGVAWVVDCVLQAAEALAEAHAAGIVHRDLKPANLFLTTRVDGSPLVKVLDFGISKAAVPGERGITRTDAVMGSPGYMAPEQIRSAKHVDQRADVWGLGIVLYELLTGKPPFDGDNIATLSAQIVLETPTPADAVRPEIPGGLAEVVARCLEKAPAERFQNVAALARALLPFGTPASAPLVERIGRIGVPASGYAETINASAATLGAAATQGGPGTQGTWERSGNPARRRTALFAAAAAGGALVVALGAFYAGRSGDSAERRAEPEARTTGVPASGGATAAAVPPIAAPPVVAPQAVGSAQPLPSASAPERVESTVKRPHTATPRAPLRPRCPAGQVLSSGHCCAAGLVWMNGRCDRPLATLP
jgi:eukaryotic-like serine/threonine-protein kinase